MLLSKFIQSYQLDKTPPSEDNQILSDMEFSDLDKSLLKKINKYPLCYYKFGTKYNNILSHARSILCSKKMKFCFDLIVSKISPSWTEACYLSWVKDFGTFLLEKIINSNFPLFLLNFVEIHMLSGYDTYLHRKFDILKDVKPFTIKRSLAPNYDRIFKKHIAKIVNDMSIYEYPNLTFDDYLIYRDNYNLMGSATLGIPMKIKTDGFRKATRIASKTTNLIYYDDYELKEQMFKYAGHVIRPFLKTDEAAKSRVVIGYDTRSYVRCSFLEMFIKSFNGNLKWTTVGDAPEALFSVREVINNNIINNNEYKGYRMICTDQSAFDQHQYKHLFIYAFNCIGHRIELLNPQVKKILDLERYGMEHAYIELPDGSRLPWENGLLSGHKFTALIGSILNKAATMTALELADIEPRFGVFQGDDALLMVDRDADYDNFLKQYSKLDLVVNPMKTWHGFNRTEYLHQVYIENQVISLPMRAILGLYFKDPKSLDVAPEQQFYNNLDQFRMANRRGLDIHNQALSYTRQFYKRYSVMNTIFDIKTRCYNYLHTPTLYGGGGFEPYVEPKYYTTLHVTKVKDQTRSSEIITPYHFRIAGDPILTKSWILKKIYAHLPEPGIVTTVIFHNVDLTRTNRIPNVSQDREDFSFNPKICDNSLNWVNHCKSLVNKACEYGMNLIDRYNRVRSSLSDSFNLTSSVTNGFLGSQDAKFWKYILRNARSSYTKTRISLDKIRAYVNYWKHDLFYSYRTRPPIWYDYGFYF